MLFNVVEKLLFFIPHSANKQVYSRQNNVMPN